MKPISIQGFIKSKEITEKILDSHFKKESEHSINMYQVKGCPICKDTINQERLPSESWTATLVCNNCNSIIFIIFSDRMSGVHVDTVYVYKEKSEEKPFEIFSKMADKTIEVKRPNQSIND